MVAQLVWCRSAKSHGSLSHKSNTKTASWHFDSVEHTCSLDQISGQHSIKIKHRGLICFPVIWYLGTTMTTHRRCQHWRDARWTRYGLPKAYVCFYTRRQASVTPSVFIMRQQIVRRSFGVCSNKAPWRNVGKDKRHYKIPNTAASGLEPFSIIREIFQLETVTVCNSSLTCPAKTKHYTRRLPNPCIDARWH
jgi:hypothetical protein